MSPVKNGDAVSPATDKSPAPQPEAKLPKTDGDEKEDKKADAPAPFTFSPSTPLKTDGDSKAPPPFQFAASTPAVGDSKAPFSFSSPTSFSFTSPAFKSPFTFEAPKVQKDGEQGEAPKSMFATWTPAAGAGVTFKPLEESAPAPGSVFGTSSSDAPTSKAEETPRVSGEEDEENVFNTRGRVFITTKREDGTAYWREHGKGPIKINVHKESKRSRIVMRTDGTFQLKMNMRIFPEMGLKKLNDVSIFISGFEGDMKPVSYLLKTRIKQESEALFDALEAQKKAATPAQPAEETKTEEQSEQKNEEKSEGESEGKTESTTTEQAVAEETEQGAPQGSGEAPAKKADEKAEETASI